MLDKMRVSFSDKFILKKIDLIFSIMLFFFSFGWKKPILSSESNKKLVNFIKWISASLKKEWEETGWLNFLEI